MQHWMAASCSSSDLLLRAWVRLLLRASWGDDLNGAAVQDAKMKVRPMVAQSYLQLICRYPYLV